MRSISSYRSGREAQSHRLSVQALSVLKVEPDPGSRRARSPHKSWTTSSHACCAGCRSDLHGRWDVPRAVKAPHAARDPEFHSALLATTGLAQSRLKCGQCPHPLWQDKACTRSSRDDPEDLFAEAPHQSRQGHVAPATPNHEQVLTPRPTRQDRKEQPHESNPQQAEGPPARALNPHPTHLNRPPRQPGQGREPAVRATRPQALSTRQSKIASDEGKHCARGGTRTHTPFDTAF